LGFNLASHHQDQTGEIKATSHQKHTEEDGGILTMSIMKILKHYLLNYVYNLVPKDEFEELFEMMKSIHYNGYKTMKKAQDPRISPHGRNALNAFLLNYFHLLLECPTNAPYFRTEINHHS
jgi:hypothetical protein